MGHAIDSAEINHLESLYAALCRLGNSYALEIFFDSGDVRRDLDAFEADWKHYNPRKPHIPRHGLSLTSLDGGLGGVPDLDSLREYNLENSTSYDEESFTTPTAALHKIKSISEPIKDFIPHLGRSHILRLGDGGFFPFHRDGVQQGAKVFRLISLLSNCGAGSFCFLYDGQRIFLDTGKLYFINTKIEHALFSFVPRATILVLNVILSEQSLHAVYNNLESK